MALLDELAFWRDDDLANPDAEVLNAIRASMATFGKDAMVIAGSSPYARRGVLPLMNSQGCQLLDHRRLLSQLHGLERRTARDGRDLIDHGAGQHDDIAFLLRVRWDW